LAGYNRVDLVPIHATAVQ